VGFVLLLPMVDACKFVTQTVLVHVMADLR